MTFRNGMDSKELAAELVVTMNDFRPAVAELARNAQRWTFCEDHKVFPEQQESTWVLRVNNRSFISASPQSVVDMAMKLANGEPI